MYGLQDIELRQLHDVFRTEPHLQTVTLYGSRAKGNYRPFSDIDITLDGADLSEEDVSRLSIKIDDLLLPYNFDISRFQSLRNPKLLDHIARRGQTLYQR